MPHRQFLEMSNFADRVKGLRKAAGLNQPELAKRVGVTKGLISQIEQGVVLEVKMELLFKLAAVLAVSARFLALGKGSPMPLGEVSLEEAELIQAFRHCSTEVRQQLISTAKLFAGPKLTSPLVETSVGLMHK